MFCCNLCQAIHPSYFEAYIHMPFQIGDGPLNLWVVLFMFVVTIFWLIAPCWHLQVTQTLFKKKLFSRSFVQVPEWQWFQTYCIAAHTGEALVTRGDLPREFLQMNVDLAGNGHGYISIFLFCEFRMEIRSKNQFKNQILAWFKFKFWWTHLMNCKDTA